MRHARLLLISFFLSIATAGWVWTQGETRLVILHTSDIHGQLLPRNGRGGMAELATLVRQSNADLVFDGGDMFTGTMISDEFQGRPLIEIMNRLEYDAAALGNHEFDYGIAALEARIREAQFPVLSANVEGVDAVRPYAVIPARGLRVGVIGVTLRNLHSATHPKNLRTVTVKNVVESVADILPEVRPRSDFIIVLAHVDRDEQFAIARAFPEIPLIIAGHRHAARTTRAGPTTIVEAGSSARYLGRVVMTLEGTTPQSVSGELLPVGSVPPDPEIEAILRPYRDAIRERAAERLGEAPADLPRGREESPLGNLIADALRAESRAEIGLQNLGGIRAALDRGPITYGDVYEVLPFQNTLVTLDLTGAELKKLLGRGVQAVSGVRVEWDLTRPYPDRLVSVALEDGSSLDDDAVYRVAVNDFMWAGGDGLQELADAWNVRDTGRLLRDVLADYIRANPRVVASVDGRAQVRD